MTKRLPPEETIHEERDVVVAEHYDVIVAGGGVAGIAAAITAARDGAKTLLIERGGSLGGTATNSLMSLIVTPFDALHGFAREFFTRLSERGEAPAFGDAVTWDPEGYKLLTAEMCREAGVTLLLYSMVVAPVMDGSFVRGVIVENKSGRTAYLAKAVVDATGDADVVALAGGECVVGRESDHAMRPVTVMGRLANVNLLKLQEWVRGNPGEFSKDRSRRILDIEGGVVRMDGFYTVVEQGKASGIIDPETPINYLRFSGLVRTDPEHTDLICNTVRIYDVDGTDARAVTDAEIAGRRQLDQIIRSIREFLPGFEDSYLIETSNQLGVRETRRIVGQYTMTWDDINRRVHFEDSVALMPSRDYGEAGVHEPDPGSEGHRDDRWARDMEIGTIFFEFPFRSLVPMNLKGILAAGRCVSVTHDADRFVRSQHSVVFTGQAAGSAAALAACEGIPCGEVSTDQLRDRLAQAGVRLRAAADDEIGVGPEQPWKEPAR